MVDGVHFRLMMKGLLMMPILNSALREKYVLQAMFQVAAVSGRTSRRQQSPDFQESSRTVRQVSEATSVSKKQETALLIDCECMCELIKNRSIMMMVSPDLKKNCPLHHEFSLTKKLSR
jgi:hypothetical protein